MAATDKFDSATARVWKSRVDDELTQIEAVIQEVCDVTASVPGSNDSIMKAIEAIGSNERIIWEDITKTFSEFSEKTQGIINAFEQFGEEALEKINSLLSRRA